MTADIVAAHVSNNSVAVSDVPNLIQQVHEALQSLGNSVSKGPKAKSPAVSVRSSVKPDAITCLQCGRKQKTLRRHLQTAHGMTPEQYRAEFGLPSRYPMTAPNYSEKRREMAKAFGLGRKKGQSPGKKKPAKTR